MKILIIDFEGFKFKNQFFFQEIAMYDYKNKSYENFFLKHPECADCKHKLYLEHHINYIPNFIGTTKFKNIIDTINQHDIIIINGKLKTNILKNITTNKIINIQNFGIQIKNKQIINSKCKYIKHLNIKNCAINKLENMVNQIIDHDILEKILTINRSEITKKTN